MIMLCGLVLKNQDLITKENFDKRNLGYVLIVVNVLVLVIAGSLAVIQFWRSNEDDYKSSNIMAILKRGIQSQQTTPKNNNENSTIELADVYSVEEGASERENPMNKYPMNKYEGQHGGGKGGKRSPPRPPPPRPSSRRYPKPPPWPPPRPKT